MDSSMKVTERFAEQTHALEEILQKKNRDFSEVELRLIANRARMLIIDMVHAAKSGHPGGPLGLADIYTYLFFRHLNISPDEPENDHRDRLLLSNGHVCAVRYSLMALRGYFPIKELYTFRQLGTRLQGHPSTRYLPSVENSSGSLGQGLSNAGGYALGLRTQKNSARVFLGMSDGECQEGMTWEAAMSAAHYRLSNLKVFLDYNDIQIDGFVHDVMDVGSLTEKFKAFGWSVREADGHDFNEIESAFRWADDVHEGPAMIVFRNTLGKGVSFMENQPGWHGKPPSDEDREKALEELDAQAQKILGEL